MEMLADAAGDAELHQPIAIRPIGRPRRAAVADRDAGRGEGDPAGVHGRGRERGRRRRSRWNSWECPSGCRRHRGFPRCGWPPESCRAGPPARRRNRRRATPALADCSAAIHRVGALMALSVNMAWAILASSPARSRIAPGLGRGGGQKSAIAGRRQQRRLQPFEPMTSTGRLGHRERRPVWRSR